MKRMRLIVIGTSALVIAVFLAGLWLERRVAQQLTLEMRGDLSTLRNSSALALHEWMRAQENAARLAASEQGVVQTATALIRSAGPTEGVSELLRIPQQKVLRDQLQSSIETWEFEGYLLIRQGRIVSADVEDFVGVRLSGQEIRALEERLASGNTYLSRPRYLAAVPAKVPVMWVASPVFDAGEYLGALAFRIDPEKSFARVFETARFGKTGEAYAFDAEGLMLSSSRFDEQLRRSRLLKPGQRPLLNVLLVDPGADLEGSLDTPSTKTPGLTKAVRMATSGNTGEDVAGYGNYLGTRVVGAWTWFPDYGFGMVVEMSQEEALSSSLVIKRATQALVAALALVSLLLVAFARLSQHLQNAVKKLGQYTLESKIGEGGMGSVYLARHALLRRPTAVKMIKADELDGRARIRFGREVQATAGLTHPNTVAIYDYGETEDEVIYYAMEYLEGLTLQQLVQDSGPLPAARVIHIVEQICGSLAEAHDAGLVHRDVKPSNIMLCQRGGLSDFVKVLDFGLVKVLPIHDTEASTLTMDTSLTGTPHYISPEVITNATQAEPRSDLYALGAIAFFLLTGEVVFSAATTIGVLTRHLADKPRRPSELAPEVVPAGLERLIMDCLKKSPADRPENARELARKLQELAAEHPWPAEAARQWWQAHGDLIHQVKKGASSGVLTVSFKGPPRGPLARTATL